MKLDGVDATAQFALTDGKLVQKTPVAPWKDGLHTCDITLGDVRGNKATARKRFFLGKPAKTPKVTLRDDGVTLVDGKPYFPIGLYGVMRREFNGNDFGKAFDGLVAGGFNTSHSYSETFDPSYLDAAQKHGFKYIQFGRLPDHRMMTKSRFDKNVLAWYLGVNTAPEEVTVRYPVETSRVEILGNPDATSASLPTEDGFSDTLAPFAVRIYRLKAQ